MGLFGQKIDRDLAVQLKAQKDLQAEQVDSQIASIPLNNPNVALDPQVSALLLQSNERMLLWVFDPETNSLRKAKKHQCLVEPKMEETTAFLPNDPNSSGLVNDIDANLSDILQYMEKFGYDENSVNLFNKISRFRRSLVGNTRLHGQLAKLSKSQIAQTSAAVKRVNDDPKKQGILGGLLG